MANIPIPENDDSLELNVRYQPDMVLEGMLDATVPEFKRLTLTMGNEVYDLASGGSSLPDIGENDEGKVLMVVEEDDELVPAWGSAALPEITEQDMGKVLTAGEVEPIWADAPSGLPEITNADEGKVLTVVDNSGTLEAEWAEPSGGGGVTVAIDDLEDEILAAIGTAVSNANTSGYQGVTISAFGSTTTQAKAALVSTVATTASAVTYGDNTFALAARYVDSFEPDPDPIIGGYLASFDFLYPVFIQGFNGYSLIIHIANGTSGQDPTLSVSVSATKLINYPSN